MDEAADMTGTSSSGGPPRVLVAEDNLMNQRVIGAFLQSFGVECVMAENGQEAIDHLCTSEFDVVLMDIQMPILDGMAAIQQIRSGATPRDDIPIVVVTANAMAGDRDTYLNAGADEYLAKPITLDALKEVLEQFEVLPAPSADAVAAR